MLTILVHLHFILGFTIDCHRQLFLAESASAQAIQATAAAVCFAGRRQERPRNKHYSNAASGLLDAGKRTPWLGIIKRKGGKCTI
jgi:hypothetical protein